MKNKNNIIYLFNYLIAPYIKKNIIKRQKIPSILGYFTVLKKVKSTKNSLPAV
jgi:hypothetical protein